jgi:hypothetical protein
LILLAKEIAPFGIDGGIVRQGGGRVAIGRRLKLAQGVEGAGAARDLAAVGAGVGGAAAAQDGGRIRLAEHLCSRPSQRGFAGRRARGDRPQHRFGVA